mgnify:CR=1 FL=1
MSWMLGKASSSGWYGGRDCTTMAMSVRRSGERVDANRVLGRADDATWRRERGIATVAVYLVSVVAVSAFLFPLWTAIPITPAFRQLHFWLPNWN